MDAWLKSFGPGQFTFGAKFLCFLPAGSVDGHVKIAQAPDGMIDTLEWLAAAERLADYLNELRDLPNPTLDEIAEYEADRKI